jgi:pimeloyl-ACP methyl ester carboxylesterase
MKIASNKISINAREGGTGNLTLLFLHYWGGSSRTWDGVVSHLANEYRTIAVDQRGWGESDAPAYGYSISDLADDAQGVIDSLGLKQFALVGHSMGGKVAQLLASRRPTGLKALVLVAPAPPAPQPIPKEQIENMKHAYDSADSIGWTVDNVLTGGSLDDAARGRIIEDSLRGAPQAKLAWPTAAIHENISGAVAAINVPTLVIGGELDKVDPPEVLRKEVLPQISQSRLEVIPGAGHLSPIEAPTEVAAKIREFLVGIPA